MFAAEVDDGRTDRERDVTGHHSLRQDLTRPSFLLFFEECMMRRREDSFQISVGVTPKFPGIWSLHSFDFGPKIRSFIARS